MTKQQIASTSFGMLALILAALPALAQTNQNCAPRDVVVERLADRYGETRQSVGLGARNQIIEVFASAETGTWTITVTNTSGVMCLVASGQAYESVAEALPTKGSDA